MLLADNFEPTVSFLVVSLNLKHTSIIFPTSLIFQANPKQKRKKKKKNSWGHYYIVIIINATRACKVYHLTNFVIKKNQNKSERA